jgi:hypothetical protein
MKCGSAKHAMIFICDERFGPVSTDQTRLEGNTTVGIRWKFESPNFHHPCDIFLLPQYSSWVLYSFLPVTIESTEYLNLAVRPDGGIR